MEKFTDPLTTLDGTPRAHVGLKSLKTLWFNTGTLCNLTCKNCYIESSPTNDRLVYLTVDDVIPFVFEIKELNLGTQSIGLTGGEPFLNPNIISILKFLLSEGLEVLVLTNANRVLKRHRTSLIELNQNYPGLLKLRVSLDHYTKERHDQERGAGAFEKTCEDLKWLYAEGFDLSIAGRSLLSETHAESIAGHKNLLIDLGVDLDIEHKLVVFPEMKSDRDVPEITVKCWDILAKSPDDQMCASERMIVKRKGHDHPSVMPCTLLAYDDQFVLGKTLREAKKDVSLNHRFCAEFCVLGGASCSSTK